MSRRAIDEGEHRRGLVLGLTLAEVLLLLLFLVMLALAAMFQEVERKRQILQNERDALQATIRTLLPRGDEGPLSIPMLVKRLETASIEVSTLKEENTKLKSENRELLEQLSELFPEGVDRSDVARVLKQAASYDPKAPAEFLKRAMEVLVAVGPSMQPEAARKMADAAKSKGEHDWPPIITISGAGKHFFQSGSSDLPPGLQELLRGSVTDQLQEMIEKYKVDVIEVVGHTDEQPIILRASNLDRTLLTYLRREPGDSVVPADNAGLGLARAVSVARQLSSDERLKSYQILPLSGGQLIDLKDRISSGRNPLPAEFRRRIEIRLRRSTGETVNAETNGPTEKQTVAPFTQQSWRQSTRPENAYLGPISGTASVVDGDTITIGGSSIRIWGVDAIERDQRCFDAGQDWDCAAEATLKLRAYLYRKTLLCQPVERDRHGRIVAKCAVDGSDVGSWLVSEGLAVDYPYYSHGTYQPEQAKAKLLKLGIWRGEFVMPWEWRKGSREATGNVH